MEVQTRELIKKGGWLGAAAVGGSLFFQSAAVSGGVMAGVVIGLGNLYLITRLVQRLLGGGTIGRTKLAALFLVKTLGLFAIIGLILLKTDVNGVAFAVGLTSVVVAMIWEGLFHRA